MSFVVGNTGEQIKAKFDGAMFNTFAGQKDYIIKDIGEEFECLYEGGALSVQVGTGQAIIGGRLFVAEENNTLDLPANSTIYLCLRIDLTQIEGQVGMLYANTTAEIMQGNLNNDSGAKRDLLIAKITTDTNGITDLQDLRTIKNTSGVGSYVGQVIFNTLATEEEVKAIYGEETSWTLLASKLPIGENVFGNDIGLPLTDNGTNRYGELVENASFIKTTPGMGKSTGQSASAQTIFTNNVVLGVPSKNNLDNAQQSYANTGLVMESVSVNMWLRTA